MLRPLLLLPIALLAGPLTACVGTQNDADHDHAIASPLPCAQACQVRHEDPACSDESRDACLDLCRTIEDTLPAECRAVGRTSLECHLRVAWTCGPDGVPETVEDGACGDEDAAFEACLFGGSVCGDGVCDADEGADCPADCEASVCGDGLCTADEVNACPADCGGPVCGDGVCDAHELGQCPADCPADACGDGACAPDEDPDTCPTDCAPIAECGDDACDADEHRACPADCVTADDGDGDGVGDVDDNCPEVPNADQADGNADGVGDACVAEIEARCLAQCDVVAACPAIDACIPAIDEALLDRCRLACTEEPVFARVIADTEGQACSMLLEQALQIWALECGDGDTDDDGRPDDADNCPNVANPDQIDRDGDGRGDACDPCPSDRDGDGLCDREEICDDVPSMVDATFRGFVFDFEQRVRLGSADDLPSHGIARNRWRYVGGDQEADLQSAAVYMVGDDMVYFEGYISPGTRDGNHATAQTLIRLDAPTPTLSFSIRAQYERDPTDHTTRFLSTFDGIGGVQEDEVVFDRLADGHLRLFAGGAVVMSTVPTPREDWWAHYGFTFENGWVTFYYRGRALGAPLRMDAQAIPAQRVAWAMIEDPSPGTSNAEHWDFGGYDDAVLFSDRALRPEDMARLATEELPCVMGATVRR